MKVGDEYLHACVDGPDFDGHLIDYDEAMRRGVMYRSFETEAKKRLIDAWAAEGHACEGDPEGAGRPQGTGALEGGTGEAPLVSSAPLADERKEA